MLSLRTSNENGFSAERDGPPRVVRGNRPRGSVASIDAANDVALSVVLDDVAWAEFVGVDLGHGCPPHSNSGDMVHWCGARIILTIDEFVSRAPDLDFGVRTMQVLRREGARRVLRRRTPRRPNVT
jgi:hypothetical protein